jgi:hypothetical protein
MQWYYVEAGQQAGPVEETVLDEMFRSGRIQPETLVWRQGMVNWQPLREARPEVLAAQAAGTAAPPVVSVGPAAQGQILCSECGKPFSLEQVIRYGDRFVCATCKPLFVQRLAEGAPLGAAGGTWVSEQDLLTREYRIEIGEALERAWRIFSQNAGLVISATLLVGLAFLLCLSISAALSTVIPFIDMGLSVLYTAPLGAGLLWFFLRLSRGEPAGIGDGFAGFGSRYGQLLLVQLVQNGLNIACLLPAGAVAVALAASGAFRPGQPFAGASVGLLALLLALGLAGILAVVYLSNLWTYALLLILDKRMSFWPAMQLSRRMVSRRWWMTFLFLFVAGIIASAGVLACVIGLLVTAPLYCGMKACLYNDNFRDLAPQSS